MEKFRSRPWMRILMIALCIILAVMIALSIRTGNALTKAELRIEAVYRKAFYETVQLTEAIATNYKKLGVAGDDARMLSLLGDISREAQAAASNLALLPFGEETVGATLKFINQAEDFAETLADRIASGEKISETDYENITAIADAAQEFHAAMLELLNRYENGEALFLVADTEDDLTPIGNSEDAYPRLLYDGPFSDAESIGDFESVRALEEVSVEQAQQNLMDFIPVSEAVYTGESHPEIDCYEFRIVSGENSISAAVTKNGGKILYLLPENDISEVRMEEAELIEIAAEFLRQKGFGDMQMSYYSAYDGILTVNFAAMQSDIVIYSELIKLQLSMADGSIIGMDAEGYLRNHRLREIPEILITQAQARENVSPRLQIESAQLCIIPKDGREYFTWEIRAADTQYGYLVYIDAENGVERELLQLINAQQGTLVM